MVMIIMMMTEDLPAVNSWVFQRFSSYPHNMRGKASTNIHGSKYSLGPLVEAKIQVSFGTVRWSLSKFIENFCKKSADLQSFWGNCRGRTFHLLIQYHLRRSKKRLSLRHCSKLALEDGLVSTIASGAKLDGWWSMELMECVTGLAFSSHLHAQPNPAATDWYIFARHGDQSLCVKSNALGSALVSIIHNYPTFCTQLLLQNPIAMSWIMREPSLSLFSRILKWVDCHLKKDNIFYPRVNVHEPSRTEPPTSSESFKCTHQHAKNVADTVSKRDKMGAGKCTFTSLSKFEFGLFRPNRNAQLQGMV